VISVDNEFPHMEDSIIHVNTSAAAYGGIQPATGRQGALQDTAPRTLAALAGRNAARPGARLLFDDGPASFEELDAAAQRVACGLQNSGLTKSDRLAVWLDNRWPWLVTLFACARLGAIAVVVNTKFRSKELGDILARSGATHLLMSSDAEGALATLSQCDSLGALRVVVDAGAGQRPRPGNLAALNFVPFAELSRTPSLAIDQGMPDDGIIIFTTSGTTSAPKFVLHDQRRVIRHGLDLAQAAAVNEHSVMFLAPPLCGTFGFSTAFAALAVGARLVVPATWDPQTAYDLMRTHGVTHCMATDDAMHRLLRVSDDVAPLPTLRLAGIAGVNPRLDGIYAEAQARGVKLVGLYGSSELQAIVSLQDPDADVAQRAKRGGRMVGANAKVRARDPRSAQILAHGEPGELEFLVPDSGMKAYYGNPDATAAAFRPDGYFRSGDLGFTESDDRFVFLARMGDTLRLGGFLVDPTEIELVLQSHPTIKEAQVIAVDTARGNRPVAFVILQPHAVLQEAELKVFVGDRLAKFKVPVRFHALQDFPRTESANAAKVQKSKLKELAKEWDFD
jgi:fatty-acyl-CoA synthase